MGKICPKLANSRNSCVLWMLLALIGTETENEVEAKARYHTDKKQS